MYPTRHKKGAKKQAQKCMKLSLFAWGVVVSHLLLNNDCSLYGKFAHSHWYGQVLDFLIIVKYKFSNNFFF
jgi:hypothetical protein